MTAHENTPVRRLMQRLVLATGLAGAAVTTAAAAGQLDYPAPRFPRYLVSPSASELMDGARLAVRQTSGRAPLGRMKSGDTVYVFLNYSQDMQVWDAIRKAWAERGVKALPVHEWEWIGMTKEAYEARAKKALLFGSDGWKETGGFEPAYVPFLPKEAQGTFANLLTTTVLLGGIASNRTTESPLKTFLDHHPEIKHYFAFGGGGTFAKRASGPQNADKFAGNWIFWTKTDILEKAHRFPAELWKAIDEQIVRPIPHVAEGDLQDPQGTKLHWTSTPQESQMWEEASGLGHYGPGHLNIYPPPAHSRWQQGVIVGTSGPVGFYPKMTLRIDEHGKLVSIEGGGKNGELFRALLNHPAFREAQFPSAPEKGYWYFNQDGLATNPKFVRNYDFLMNGFVSFPVSPERNRAGVIHVSFASPVGASEVNSAHPGADIDYANKMGLPLSHTAHEYLYFPTVKWKLRDTGEWLTVVDKGRLGAFDNPEIRALAAKYGDPDTLFSYDWVPALPGVNVPGNFEKEYAEDPWSWVVKEWKQIKSGTYKYFIGDYDMFARQTGS